ncbi:protein Wiz [Esox lucius]|uniref:protein Wiz n=1 Tax=Esox lucius TaxID=8010 RepID=UPI001476CC6C|nr:protein Wiz [Esox lucius]
MDNTAAKGVAPVMCEVCGTYFETRRGLSSHARLHLRQLGVAVSDNSGAPIDLLYQLIQDRDGSMRPPKPVFSSPKKPKEPGSLAPRKDSPTGGKVKVVTTPQKNAPPGTTGPTARKGTVLAKPRQPSGSPFLAADKTPAPPAVSSLSSAKPAWAPQETDAPLTLAMDSNDEVHVCQLCGAWYESRKGLASHCRAHLRQFGITDNTEDKGGPIEFLYQVMEAEDLKPIASEGLNVYNPSVSSPSTKRPPSASPAKHRGLVKGDHPSSPQQPVKRPKPSASEGSAPQDSSVITGDFRCVLCGEEFENRKGLASHSRSHLRQLGITDLLGKASAIDTVQQLVSSGVLAAAASVRAGAAKVPSPAPPGSPPTSPAASHLSPPMSSHVQNPRPKARKGSTLVRPKPEPMEMEVDLEFSSPLEGYRSSNGPHQKGSNSGGNAQSCGSGQELMVPCDFCGQSFDSRKALSCHARSHLRQLGVTWSVNESPITLLQDIMQKGGSASSTEVKRETASGQSSAGPAWANHRQVSEPAWTPQGSKRTFTPPLDYSLKDRPSSDRNGTQSGMAAGGETCCELCGFDFENRTALASHARAHLRQLGVKEWRTEGVKASPIEMLTAWIQRQPRKAAEIHRQYRVGDLNVRFKRSAHSGSPSAGSAHSGAQRTAAPGLQLGHRAGREAPCASARTSQGSQGDRRYAAADASMPGSRGDLVRSPRGLERRFPKHGGHAEGAEGDRGSQQHSRSGNIPSLVPRPPSTPLVKQMGRQYTLKCRFCDALFLGSQSVQEDWIRHLQKHILDLSFNKASPPPTPAPDQPLGLSAAPPATAPVLLAPVAV